MHVPAQSSPSPLSSAPAAGPIGKPRRVVRTPVPAPVPQVPVPQQPQVPEPEPAQR